MRIKEVRYSLTKVISGGQTGVDQAALSAARDADLETGGWAPEGWKTKRGSESVKLREFGLKELKGKGYRGRTWANVDMADATLCIARNFDSPGMKCTQNAIEHFGRPYCHVELRDYWRPRIAYEVYCWLRNQQVGVLNVAGNSEPKGRDDIFHASYHLLLILFNMCNPVDIDEGAVK
jgi:hypothetical protein